MSKLIQFKKILTMKEAANYLTKSWNEDVVEADVLQFALDRHLTISVNFINPEKARCNIKEVIDGVIQTSSPHRESQFNKEIITIDGVWDLLMLGEETLTVRKKIQELTNGVKLQQETIKNSDNNANIGTYLKNDEGLIIQIQSHFGKENLISNKDLTEPWDHIDNYWPMNGLPADSVLVVRKSELQKFEDQISNSEINAPLVESERNSLLKMIFGMAKQKYKYNPDADKNSATSKIKEDVELSGITISDDSVLKYLSAASKRFHNNQ